jgi:hypothetical protein
MVVWTGNSFPLGSSSLANHSDYYSFWFLYYLPTNKPTDSLPYVLTISTCIYWLSSYVKPSALCSSVNGGTLYAVIERE